MHHILVTNTISYQIFQLCRCCWKNQFLLLANIIQNRDIKFGALHCLAFFSPTPLSLWKKFDSVWCIELLFPVSTFFQPQDVVWPAARPLDGAARPLLTKWPYPSPQRRDGEDAEPACDGRPVTRQSVPGMYAEHRCTEGWGGGGVWGIQTPSPLWVKNGYSPLDPFFSSPPPPLLACQRGWWCTRIPLHSVWKINHQILRSPLPRLFQG